MSTNLCYQSIASPWLLVVMDNSCQKPFLNVKTLVFPYCYNTAVKKLQSWYRSTSLQKAAIVIRNHFSFSSNNFTLLPFCNGFPNSSIQKIAQLCFHLHNIHMLQKLFLIKYFNFNQRQMYCNLTGKLKTVCFIAERIPCNNIFTHLFDNDSFAYYYS